MRIHTLAIAIALVAGGLCVAGCESGASQPANSAYFGPGSAPHQPNGGGASLPQPFRAIGIHSDLLRGATNGYQIPPMGPTGPGLVGAGLCVIYVNDPDIQNPTLVIDNGATGTFVASGAPPVGTPNWLGFVTPLLPTGSLYKVIGDQNGQRVESNSVTVAAINRGTITITEPFGDYTGLSTPIAAPPRCAWLAIGGGGVSTPESYVVMLGFPAQPGIVAVQMGATAPPDLEWLAVVPGAFTTYTWGDQTADHFAILGPDPIPNGRHELSILAADNTGWCTDCSDSATAPIVAYTFEVQ